MREDDGLAHAVDKVAEGCLDSLDKGEVVHRERAQLGRPFRKCAIDRLLDAERVGEAGVALTHHAVGIALELHGLATRSIGCAGSTRRARLEVPARASLSDDGRARLALGTLGRGMAGGRARMLADPLGLVARLGAVLALARVTRLLATVVAAAEELAADLSARDAIL